MSSLGRIADPLRALILNIVNGRIDYHALYPCTVVTQNSNGTLALLPDDDRIRGTGTDNVDIKIGIPGVTVVVSDETRVLLGFEAGDPQRPFASLWTSEGLEEIVITASTSVTVNCDQIDLADALAAMLRNGEIVNITGVMSGAGVTGATLTVNPGTFPGFGPSKVKG